MMEAMNNSIIWSKYTKSGARADWYEDVADLLFDHINNLIAIAHGVEPHRVSLNGARLGFYKYREGYYRDLADSLYIDGAHGAIQEELAKVRRDLYFINGKL
jgi:hypothetical protein